MRMLLSLGVVLAFATLVVAEDPPKDKQQQDKQQRQIRGTIVKVDAEGSMLTVRDENDKEHMLKVNNTTKLWDKERKPLSDGLRGTQFKEGTPVWFRLGTGAEQEKTITELRFFDPAASKDKEPGDKNEKDKDK